MPNKRIRYLANVIMISLSLVFFALIVIRAQKLAITHDEAFTYQNYVERPVKGIVLYRGPALPNNHILNTLLAKASVKLLGLSTFNLRLPNVLFALVFFWNAAWLSKNLRTVWSQVCAFLILSAQVYFFDFFALARGYGMALALLMASLHHFYLYLKVNNGNHTYRTLIFAALAVYANFSFLYVYLGIIAVLPLMAYADGQDSKKEWWRLFRAILVVSILLGSAIYVPLRQISKMLFGGTSGFWEDTVQSLLNVMLYHNYSNWLTPLSIGVAVILIGTGVLMIFDAFILKKEKRFFYQPLLLVLLITAGLQWVQHTLLGTEYLVARTALSYGLVFLTLIVFVLERMQEPRIEAWLRNLIFSGVAVLVLINLIDNINLRSTLDWQYDAANKQLLKDLQKEVRQEQGETILLGATWLLEPSLNFYQAHRHSNWLQPIERYQPAEEVNFFALYPAEDAENEAKAQAENWQLLKTYKNGLELYRLP